MVSVPASATMIRPVNTATSRVQHGIPEKELLNRGDDAEGRGEEIERQRRPVEEVRIEVAGEHAERVADRLGLVRPRVRIRQPEPDRERSRKAAARRTIAHNQRLAVGDAECIRADCSDAGSKRLLRLSAGSSGRSAWTADGLTCTPTRLRHSA